MRIKYSLLDKIKNLTSSEMDFLLYIAKKQDLHGYVIGVHNQDVCKNTGMCKQSFYSAMRGLEKKGIITVKKGSEIDYNILINDNDFSKENSFKDGYINLQRSVFHKKAFKKLKAKEKWLLMYFLHITHENSSSYRIGTKMFYEKFSCLLGVCKRVVRSYLRQMRAFFSVGIKNGKYYITYKHQVFSSREREGTETNEHEHFVSAIVRRNKIRNASKDSIKETARLIKQYRQIASSFGYNIKDVLRNCIVATAKEKEHPKERVLNSKYIHKLVRKALALN